MKSHRIFSVGLSPKFCVVRGVVRYLKLDKNSAEVDIAPAFGEITTACNVGQAKNGSWCLLEE